MYSGTRVSSAQTALRRAQLVLDEGFEPPKAAAALGDQGGGELSVMRARAEAAEAGMAALGAQLRAAKGALRVAAEEFGEAMAASAALEEENGLLEQILEERTAQVGGRKFQAGKRTATSAATVANL